MKSSRFGMVSVFLLVCTIVFWSVPSESGWLDNLAESTKKLQAAGEEALKLKKTGNDLWKGDKGAPTAAPAGNNTPTTTQAGNNTPTAVPAGNNTPTTTQGTEGAGTAMARNGENIYKTGSCGACHGADGQGTPNGNSFKGNKFISSSSDEVIAEVIRKGRTRAAKKYKQYPVPMPPYAALVCSTCPKLSDEEASALVAFLKSLASR